MHGYHCHIPSLTAALGGLQCNHLPGAQLTFAFGDCSSFPQLPCSEVEDAITSTVCSHFCWPRREEWELERGMLPYLPICAQLPLRTPMEELLYLFYSLICCICLGLRCGRGLPQSVDSALPMLWTCQWCKVPSLSFHLGCFIYTGMGDHATILLACGCSRAVMVELCTTVLSCAEINGLYTSVTPKLQSDWQVSPVQGWSEPVRHMPILTGKSGR